MTIFIFGNPDLAFDSLPLKILPKLKENFPNIYFEVKDPNEEWDSISDVIAIDTVVGLRKVETILDLDMFTPPPRISMHDFDAFSNLKYMQKLGKIGKATIIGIPLDMKEDEALKDVRAEINDLVAEGQDAVDKR